MRVLAVIGALILGLFAAGVLGWGAYAMPRPGFMRRQWEALLPMIESGVVDPPVATTYPLADVARALGDLEQRKVLGKTVLLLR